MEWIQLDISGLVDSIFISPKVQSTILELYFENERYIFILCKCYLMLLCDESKC